MSFTVSTLNFLNAKQILEEGLKAIANGEHECDLSKLEQVDSAMRCGITGLAKDGKTKQAAPPIHKYS